MLRFFDFGLVVYTVTKSNAGRLPSVHEHHRRPLWQDAGRFVRRRHLFVRLQHQVLDETARPRQTPRRQEQRAVLTNQRELHGQHVPPLQSDRQTAVDGQPVPQLRPLQHERRR